MRRKYQHRILIALLLLATPFYGLYSQTNSAEGEWETYSIPEVCSFAIPNTLEVRSNESFYGKFVKAMYQSSLLRCYVMIATCFLTNIVLYWNRKD